MRGRKRREVPARLSRLKERFAAWRKTRQHGERIPPPLWRAAAKLAKDCGLNQTATVLKLDYYSLKKRVDGQNSDASSSPAFVELRSTSMPLASECVIEFDDGAGASMRVHLRGAEVPDVLALGRGFWNSE